MIAGHDNLTLIKQMVHNLVMFMPHRLMLLPCTPSTTYIYFKNHVLHVDFHSVIDIVHFTLLPAIAQPLLVATELTRPFMCEDPPSFEPFFFLPEQQARMWVLHNITLP